MAWYTTGSLDEFDAVAGDFLRVRPAENTILLSSTENLRVRGGRTYGSADPLFGWWQPNGRIEGAFMCSPPYPAVITEVPVEAVPALVRTLAGVERINAEKTVAQAYAREWQRAGITARVEMRTRLYRLGELTPPEPAPGGQARVAGRADRDLLLSWYEAFLGEIGEAEAGTAEMVDDRIGYGGMTLWETDTGAVSMAGRTRPVAGMVRIGPVFTPPQARRQGYGAAVTAALSAAARELAEEILLFTDLSNPTSNAIYQRIGYRPVQDRLVLSYRS
jgi:GNAT superfamily N-acetyltransferase